MAKKIRYAGIDMKQLFAHLVEGECDTLEQYIDAMDGGLKHKVDNFKSFMDRMTAGEDDEAAQRTYDHFSDDIANLTQHFPSLLWQSVFISLYSFFEQEMSDICRRVRRIANKKGMTKTAVPKSADGLPGQKCLAEFKIKLATKSPEWKRFKSYRLLRHLLAHNRGFLRDDDESERIREFVRRHRNITIDSRKRVELNKEFCRVVLKDLKKLLFGTVKAVPKKLFQP